MSLRDDLLQDIRLELSGSPLLLSVIETGQWPSTTDQEGFEYLSLWVHTLQKALLRLADGVERLQVL
ncbi:MAG TPA: hypothetical protein VE596_07075 [Gaiellaceae bacterium]|jgi:hypothetical protein|nr:hypothetical protein [Gaiellaceae bacterium]